MHRTIRIPVFLLSLIAGCTLPEANKCTGERALDVCDQASAEDGYGLPDYPGC